MENHSDHLFHINKHSSLNFETIINHNRIQRVIMHADNYSFKFQRSSNFYLLSTHNDRHMRPEIYINALPFYQFILIIPRIQEDN